MFSRLTASTWKFSCSDLQTADCLLIVGECAGGSKGMPALLISPSRVWPFMRDLTSPAALWTAASSVTSKSSGVKKSPNSPCSRFASASFLTLWWQLYSQERGNPHLTNNKEGASLWYSWGRERTCQRRGTGAQPAIWQWHSRFLKIRQSRPPPDRCSQ